MIYNYFYFCLCELLKYPLCIFLKHWEFNQRVFHLSSYPAGIIDSNAYLYSRPLFSSFVKLITNFFFCWSQVLSGGLCFMRRNSKLIDLLSIYSVTTWNLIRSKRKAFNSSLLNYLWAIYSNTNGSYLIAEYIIIVFMISNRTKYPLILVLVHIEQNFGHSP